MNTLLLAGVCALASACICPDPHRETRTSASRADFGAEIDACFAMDSSCEPLCRKVLQLDVTSMITTCAVTAASDTGVDLDIVYLPPGGCEG